MKRVARADLGANRVVRVRGGALLVAFGVGGDGVGGSGAAAAEDADRGEVAPEALEVLYVRRRRVVERRPVDPRHVARALIGYEPKVVVREGLRRTFAAFKALYA